MDAVSAFFSDNISVWRGAVIAGVLGWIGWHVWRITKLLEAILARLSSSDPRSQDH